MLRINTTETQKLNDLEISIKQYNKKNVLLEQDFIILSQDKTCNLITIISNFKEVESISEAFDIAYWLLQNNSKLFNKLYEDPLLIQDKSLEDLHKMQYMAGMSSNEGELYSYENDSDLV